MLSTEIHCGSRISELIEYRHIERDKMNGKEDPRYDTDKSATDMRKTLMALERNTHKFVQEHNDLSKKAEYLKYQSFIDERNNYRSGQSDPRYNTSNVGKELRETLSMLQKTTYNFIRAHDELANRAEYLKYTDFVRQHTKHNE